MTATPTSRERRTRPPSTAGCSVHCDVVMAPDEAAAKAAAACSAAIVRRGAAVLIVPETVSTSMTDDAAPPGFDRTRPASTPSADDLRGAAGFINLGEKIAICGGADCRGASQEVFALAEILKAPIAHTLDAKHVLEPGNPYSIGTSGVHAQEVACDAIGRCDTLIVLGAASAAGQAHATSARVLQLDAGPASNGLRAPADVAMIGDIRDTLRALMPLLVPRISSEFRDACVFTYSRWSQSWRSISGRQGRRRPHLRRNPGRAHRPIRRRRRSLLVGQLRSRGAGFRTSDDERQAPAVHDAVRVDDHERDVFGTRPSEMPAGPAGHLHVQRSGNLGPLRRSVHDPPGRTADQDRRLRCGDSRVCSVPGGPISEKSPSRWGSGPERSARRRNSSEPCAHGSPSRGRRCSTSACISTTSHRAPLPTTQTRTSPVPVRTAFIGETDRSFLSAVHEASSSWTAPPSMSSI